MVESLDETIKWKMMDGLKEGQWFSLWDYFRLYGFKISEPKKVPTIEFLQIDRTKYLIPIDYTRCTLFDNWPKNEDGTLVWDLGIPEERQGKLIR